jgi:hypothetical protein
MAMRLIGFMLLTALLATGVASGSKRTPPRCTIKGTEGQDMIRGTSHRDVICGFGGADVIHAGSGADLIRAGRGDDVVYAGTGRDIVIGSSGSDTFFAVDRARDFLDGGTGRDRARFDRDRVRSVERFFKPAPYPHLLAAGDIASCGRTGDDETAVLLDLFPQATVATLGDTVYEKGTDDEFAKCYHPTWGRAKGRTRPSVGDHEYLTPGAAGYFRYFGAAAGEPGKGYYSYNLGTWHVVVLNSNCRAVGGCSPNSPQTLWLRADLAADASPCTLAYSHRPRFSSGATGDRPVMGTLWQALYADGVDVALAGDDHLYERFAPQTPSGTPDSVRGIREFVVGTGGRSFSPFGTFKPQSEVRNNSTYGVLKLSLRPGSYAWEFLPIAGQTFDDRGNAACH